MALKPLPTRAYAPQAVEHEARRMLTEFVMEKFPQLVRDWDALTPPEQWGIFVKILPYVAPKLSAVTVKSSGNNAVEALLALATQGPGK